MTHFLPQKIEWLFDFIADKIINITDYFIVLKHVALSEWLMLAFSVGYSMWFVIYDVQNSSVTFQHLYNETAWSVIFCVVSAVHIFGIVRNSRRIRRAVMMVFALIWLILLFIFGSSAIASLINPTALILSVLSVIVAVRLSKEVDDER